MGERKKERQTESEGIQKEIKKKGRESESNLKPLDVALFSTHLQPPFAIGSRKKERKFVYPFKSSSSSSRLIGAFINNKQFPKRTLRKF